MAPRRAPQPKLIAPRSALHSSGARGFGPLNAGGFGLERDFAMSRLRIGLVGAGFAARYHVACLRRVYGAPIRLAGVTSARPESRAAFGAAHDIPVFADLETMLDHVDVVHVCSPPYAHEAGILAAAAAGKGHRQARDPHSRHRTAGTLPDELSRAEAPA